VAASTSFQHSRTATIRPGQSVALDGYRFRYVRPTASASAQKLTFGAVIAVTSGRHRVATLHSTYGLYPSQDPTQGPIGRFFNGSNESRVGLDAGLLSDIWIDLNPNVTPLQKLIAKGDATFQPAINNALRLPPAAQSRALSFIYGERDVAIEELVSQFVTHPWASTFLVIVSPLVTWLWLGAIIAALGGLIALWPLPPAGRRRRAPAPSPVDGTVAGAPPIRAPELV
jgi:cytochrome c-type biogenesis protein CcmF